MPSGVDRQMEAWAPREVFLQHRWVLALAPSVITATSSAICMVVLEVWAGAFRGQESDWGE